MGKALTQRQIKPKLLKSQRLLKRRLLNQKLLSRKLLSQRPIKQGTLKQRPHSNQRSLKRAGRQDLRDHQDRHLRQAVKLETKRRSPRPRSRQSKSWRRPRKKPSPLRRARRQMLKEPIKKPKGKQRKLQQK